jgi:hypothetical protein
VFISEFNVQLLFLPGLKNVVADFLSRPAPQATGSVAATSAADPVDFEEMAAEQHRCPETQRLLGGTSLKIAFRQTGAQCLDGDVSTSTFRPIVPSDSEKVFLIISTMLFTPLGLPLVVLFHPSLCGTDFPATSPPGPASLACQRGKIHRHKRLAPQPISIPQQRFSHRHVDLVGPLQYSNTFNYTCILLLTTHPNGLMLFHFQKRPRRHVLKL